MDQIAKVFREPCFDSRRFRLGSPDVRRNFDVVMQAPLLEIRRRLCLENFAGYESRGSDRDCCSCVPIFQISQQECFDGRAS